MTDLDDTAKSRISFPLVVVSDVHLRSPDDDRCQLLLDSFRRLDRDVEYLVLNGDIFDFCFGDSAYFRDKFGAVGRALGEVAERGTRVLFIEGNHEFHIEQMGWSGVEVIRSLDAALELKSGVRVMVSHGDLIVDDPLYRAFRGLLKSQWTRWIVRLLPGAWLDSYALMHAKVSRSQDPYRQLHHDRVLGGFERWLDSKQAHHGIIGHFHFPYAERRKQNAGWMLSVESWDRPNILVFNGELFSRGYLASPGSSIVFEPARSVLSTSLKGE